MLCEWGGSHRWSIALNLYRYFLALDVDQGACFKPSIYLWISSSESRTILGL
jgi:hypothetical protein